MTSKRLALGAPFSSHLVLQRGRENPIWGFDNPHQTIRLRVLGAFDLPERTTRAAADGKFSIACPELRLGVAYTLELEGSGIVRLEDVVAGDVWLASGQSNMEWKVANALDAEREIASARIPSIRTLKVAPRPALEPQSTANGHWVVASPETAGEFSAVGYFYARELVRALDVPVGILDATWGGTSIRSWLSLEALSVLEPGVRESLAEIEAQDVKALERAYAESLRDWQRRALPADPPNRGEQLGFHTLDFDERSASAMDLPKFWQAAGLAFNGVVWFRKTIELPPEFASRNLSLSLGAIDDFDHTYFNGELVGAHPSGTPNAHQIERRYDVPGHLVHGGKNVIAVRVFDHFGQGGFAGPRNLLYVEGAEPGRMRIPIDGPWRYLVEHEIELVSADVFATCPEPPLALARQHAPGALFNGMLAPLIPYGLRGALWYQGESDVERHAVYSHYLLTLIRDLRTRFGQGQFPFYFVQLANYRSATSWAYLREAQSQALSEPETGMAVAIDIGEALDIHPKNKQEVARRLALLARARAYGEKGVVDSGPTLERIEIAGGIVRVSLTNAAGLCTSDGKRARGFELAGDDGVFHAAEAKLAPGAVLLTAEAVPEPHAVRYAFTAHPDANLENGAGLPALPFRSDCQ